MLSAVRVEQRGAVQFCARLGRSPSETHTLLKNAYQQDALRKAATRTYHNRYKTMGSHVYKTTPKVKKTRTRRLKKSNHLVKDNTDIVNYIINQQANRDMGSDGQSEIGSLGSSENCNARRLKKSNHLAKDNRDIVNYIINQQANRDMRSDGQSEIGSLGSSETFTDVGDCENESIGNSDHFTDIGDCESETMSNSEDYNDVPDVTPDIVDESVDSFQNDSCAKQNLSGVSIENYESMYPKNTLKEKKPVQSPIEYKNPKYISNNKKKSKNNAHGFYLKLNGEIWKIKSYQIYN